MSIEIIIDKIKKNFLLKKFKNCIINCESLHVLNTICTQENSFFLTESEKNNEKFDDISKYISKKKVVDDFSNILKIYYRWNNINDSEYFIKLDSRKFLIGWLISYCPDFILGNFDSNHNDSNQINFNEKKYVYENAKLLISMITDLSNNINIDFTYFNKVFLSYSNNILIFLEKDKIDKINYYTSEWISLDKSYDYISKSIKYDDEQKNIILKNINNDKKIIEKYLNKIAKNFDYDRLRTIIRITNDISKKIIDNYKKIINEEINNNNYDVCVKILDIIKKFILLFNVQPDKINLINNQIDSDFFIDLLKKNIINVDDVKVFGDFMIKEICNIGSISCEIENLQKWNKIKSKFNYDSDISDIIANMLIFSLELIDIIRNELNDYHFLLS